MEPQQEIINRVASSSLVTFDLETYYPKGERVLLDIKDQLFQGLILKEKDFREYVKANAWSQYQGKFVAVTCSEDVVIPTWAYMLIGSSLQPFAKTIVFGSLQDLEARLFDEILDGVNWQEFEGAKVVIKGCSKFPVPVSAYMLATQRLRPYAQSIMFGEPCSTVPVFKRPKPS